MTLILATYILIALLTIAVYNLWSADRMEDLSYVEMGQAPKVSVLLVGAPTGNEAGERWTSLLESDYPHLEFWTLGESGSGPQSPRLRHVRPEPRPEGWNASAWERHQLARASDGEILLFCDRRITAGRQAVGRTVAWLLSQRLACLTAFPFQETPSWQEKAVIPLLIHAPLVALLPLRKVLSLPLRRLAVAGSHWLAITREAYVKAGGYEGVRSKPLADFALARKIKDNGQRLLPLIAAEDLSIRMYQGWNELRSGVSGWLYPAVGGTEAALVLTMIGFSLVAVIPWIWVLIGHWGWLIPLTLLTAVRGVARATFRTSWESVALHPVGSLAALHLVVDSYLRYQHDAE